jgi:hypothetical protein
MADCRLDGAASSYHSFESARQATFLPCPQDAYAWNLRASVTAINDDGIDATVGHDSRRLDRFSACMTVIGIAG